MITLLRRILSFTHEYRARIRVAFVFSFIKSLFTSAPIMVAAISIFWLLEGTMSIERVCMLALGLLVVLGVQALCQYGADYLQSSTGYELFAKKRIELGEHLRKLPMGYFTEGNIGKISSILSADMVFIEENCMMILANVISDIFVQIILTAFLFVLNPLLGLIAVAFEIVIMIIGYLMNRAALKRSHERQESIEYLNDSIIEYTEGIGVIKSFNMSGSHARRLRGSFSRMTATNLDFEKTISPYFCALLITVGVGVATILALCISFYQNGSMELFPTIAMMLFLFGLFNPMRHLYGESSSFAIMQVALDRFESLMAEPELEDNGTLSLPKTSSQTQQDPPEIEFDQVFFGYEEETVLNGISFSVKRGQMCALVGPSGCGKTTIANLLMRFWDISDGELRVRGKDVRTVSLAELVDNISMVFQRVYLFEDTVYNNIRIGKHDATPEEVHEAARKARCYDFIMSLPYGFDTPVGESGATLSGGEAQRISIARCILKDAPIVVLDEATASVDPDNELAIQEAINELCRDKTLLVIAHRLHTIRNASKILVIEKGMIAEQGTHDELMALGGRYRKMYAMQDHVISWSDAISKAGVCA